MHNLQTIRNIQMSNFYELVRNEIINNGLAHPDKFLSSPLSKAFQTAINTACLKLASGEFNANEKDAEGNTVLHLVLGLKLRSEYHRRHNKPNITTFLEALLKNGGDLASKNSANETPLDLYAKSDCHVLEPERFLDIIASYCLSDIRHDQFIMSALDVLAKTYVPKSFIHKFDSFLYFKKNKLILDTLKLISCWFNNLKKTELDGAKVEKWNQKEFQETVEKCKQTLDGEIQLLEQAWHLPKLIDSVLNANRENRKIFRRAMLLGGETPLLNLLENLCKEPIWDALDGQLTHACFKSFIKEYEQDCRILEELKAQPLPLSKDELKLVKPICDQLDAILYRLVNPAFDEKWRKRVRSYGSMTPQQEMQARYNQYQGQDRLTRDTLFREYAQHQTQIAEACTVAGSHLVAGLRIKK